MKLPGLRIGKVEVAIPIIQGGMGIGVSNYKLAGAVAREGGLGILSSAALDRLVGARQGKKRINAREATAIEVRDARELAHGGPIGMNIMVAVVRQYADSVLGTMDGGANCIVSGAGLPLQLPEIVNSHIRAKEVALVPIVSSGRALELICRRWKRSGRTPDAVVVEGPKAGGHIAWRTLKEARAPGNRLENLIKEILPVAKKWGQMPVIAAGGIYTHEDICKYLDMGCAGVQMGTRFLATFESGASEAYKQKVIDCKKEDIILAEQKGSPCGMLFHVIKSCPFYEEALAQTREPKCSKGYVLSRDLQCSSKTGKETFCICNGLLASTGLNQEEKELHTVGSNGYRVNKLVSVKELMDELKSATVEQASHVVASHF